MNDNCIFCKLANGIIDTNSIYEDDNFNVILDANPASKGHAIILPKEHFSNLFELSDRYASALIPTAKKVSSAMKDILCCDGFNLVQNNGEVAGQTVFHFHLHLIPRYKGDTVNLTWKPGTLDAAFAKDFSEKMKAFCR